MKFYIHTWGCQMNVYDSERLADLLTANGYEEVPEAESADIILLNTCAVRENAKEKIYHQLGRWKELKKGNPRMIIGVGGCVASADGEEIFRRAPEVDIVFGPQTMHLVPGMIEKVIAEDGRQIDISFPELEKFNILPPIARGAPSAYVTITEGCSNFCTYCIVPFTRGPVVSRTVREIMEEVQRDVDSGVREIHLLGQNVNEFAGLSEDGSESSLAELLYKVSAVEGVGRIRFTTSNPKDLNDETIAAIGELPKIASHIHLPVQSGSDRILALMNRPYTAESYLEKVAKLRAARPGISISSDFIVGFPGETDDDFEETVTLADQVGFDQSFSFVYSPRPGTKAAAMKDPETLENKKERLYCLQKHLTASADAISLLMKGTEQTILVDAHAKKDPDGHSYQGRTENNRIVNFRSEEDLIGEFARVWIDEVLPHSLTGSIIESDE